ncbi:MAG: 4-hydroxy-tetrahydrodipicolinate reductase [Holosporaceae bacterium]|jgi:4-hydroxy-tetrahydrodipicolinate reductase|nr:4-hydroxy-tetrahydrodipicolinate reductase [Holosporaceae bacterium]
MKIGIIGVSGRMGKALAALILSTEQVGGANSKTSADQLMKIAQSSDVLIDFSSPQSAVKAMEIASVCRIPMVSGTTGFSENDYGKMKKFSETIPILHSNNFSLGIQVMAALIRKCSDIFPHFDVAIIDRHHNRKKDAPSGTALFLAEQARKSAQIVSLREGNIFGEHTCDFTGENEMLSISHRVFNREVFADGALKCARWILGKDPGLYSIQDCIRDAVCSTGESEHVR